MDTQSGTLQAVCEQLAADGVCIDTVLDFPWPAQRVFDYVTTPALWHTWHPATAEVREVPQRPLTLGETMLEVIRVAGRSDQALWTVTHCMPGQRWDIVTETGKGYAHIIYRFESLPGGCRFHRQLRFRSKGIPWRWLDHTLMRAVLIRQSRHALHNLLRVLSCTFMPESHYLPRAEPTT